MDTSSGSAMALAEQILVEFVESAWIGREHKISPMLYLRSKERHVVARKKSGLACDRCGRTKCRCAKRASSKHRRDYKLHPRRKL